MTLLVLAPTRMNVSVGEPIELYCPLITPGEDAEDNEDNVIWTTPGGRTIDKQIEDGNYIVRVKILDNGVEN